MEESTRKHLSDQLIKLGDMMGEGLHLESDGKWISKEYKRVAKALGYIPKEDRSLRISSINDVMKKRVHDVSCLACEGELKQTRSGSKRANCQNCGWVWQLLK
jgi:ribosomal protein L37AE/L43A